MTTADFLTSEVPDPEAAKRFLQQLTEKHPSHAAKLKKNDGLYSDVLVIVSCSPLFASTLLQFPEYLAWLDRERMDTRVRDKQALLESLARFAATHSTIEPNAILARFRRRELMRIFLRDIRRLATVSEVTEEVSNLADAILEHALRLSKQELDNRFGQPQEIDDRGRPRRADISVIALGKLGSKELNYSSDIDLLFVFSENGTTSGAGTQSSTSNLEYFSRLTQAILKLVGSQDGEGAAYRVDMRLRPHGRVGPLTLPFADTLRYYRTEAAAWERQVLIRSRASAGSEKLFRKFYAAVEDKVFSSEVPVDVALENVRLSKHKIDLSNRSESGTDIKLGRGGIREIEFISQALQLAHGGTDKWLRVPHTLVSLGRLADRGYLSSIELTRLFDAYDFLRRLEHVLQIENGLQTHSVPADMERRSLFAKRLGHGIEEFDTELDKHLENVRTIFDRVFQLREIDEHLSISSNHEEPTASPHDYLIERIKVAAPRFLEIVNAHPEALESVSDLEGPFPDIDYSASLRNSVDSAHDFGDVLCHLRKCWYRHLIEIVVFEAFGKLELEKCKEVQTRLAAASIEVALAVAYGEAAKRFGKHQIDSKIAILALGKLGSGGMDYDSDLDLVFVHDDETPIGSNPDIPRDRMSATEFYSRVIEIFTTVLSSITRDGSLYRVDLRLRPHGSDGPLVISRKAIVEYFRTDAAVWELLAYVKLRAVGGETEFANMVENKLRDTIHERALTIEPSILAAETRAVRDKLEKQKSKPRSNEIDIKYGPGGLLDIYFAVRYLQLRFGIRDDEIGRTTSVTFGKLMNLPTLNHFGGFLNSLSDGYSLLYSFDHHLRKKVGRSSRIIPNQIKGFRADLTETLALTLIDVRAAFDQILSESHH